MKEQLEEAIAEGLSTRQMSERFGKSQTAIRHQLKKYGIKTNHKRSIKQYTDTHKVCSRCKQRKILNEFYAKNKKGDPGSWCKLCMSESVVLRQRSIKQEALEYKGGKCICCDFSKHPSALDFHHLDMNEKEFDISRWLRKGLSDAVKKELDKCVVLCSNCHRMVHAGAINLDL